MKKELTLLLTAALALSWISSCGDDPLNQNLAEYCNPISADNCLLPWPSSFYLKKDSTTKTGFRVNYPDKALPKFESTGANDPAKHMDPARVNLLDGFPIGSQIVAFFKAGISKTGLPALSDLASSMTDKSLIWLMEMKTSKKVPLFAEVDANVKGDEVPALIVRPMERLAFDTRYVVVLRVGLKDSKGANLAPPEPFRKIRDSEKITEKVLLAEAGRMKDVMDFLDQQKIPRSLVLLAWDFHTVSQDALQVNLKTMLDTALSKIPATGPAFADITFDDKDITKEPEVLRAVEGSFMVPSFLASDDDDSWLKLDAQGKPVYRGMQKFFFYLHIPRCAATATTPLPILFFGHGLFGTRKGDLTSGYHKKLQNELCAVTVSTEWLGLSESDVPAVTKQIIAGDFTNMPRITDRLQQAQVNAATLVKLLKGDFLKHKSMLVNNKAITDGKTVYYLGISNGGIQGVAFASLTKDIERFVFNVSGGMWSMMIPRSSNFAILAMGLERRYPSAVDRAALVSLSQHLWEYTDPITWAPHVLGTPLPGRTKKKVILQESKDDDQVPNMATRVVARALGLTHLSPVVESVYGLTPKAGPLDSAFVQWSTNPPVKPPGTNTPAPKPLPEQSAHLKVRTLDTWKKQVLNFLKPQGTVKNFCSGPCDPD